MASLLEDCKKPSDSYDLLGGLFDAMNTPGKALGGRYKGVDYFNGGLFAHPVRIELYEDEVNQLKEASRSDWSKVRPEIFGTLFEHSLGQEERHAFGAHFTHPTDIMKIVGPTIVEPWRERIENAKSGDELGALLKRMQGFTVLDPACGSGNFLYIAYREIKRLESRLLERGRELAHKLTKKREKRYSTRPSLGFVKASQFYGMDINPFAVELAKVTMMIARKLAIDELHSTEEPLPLDNLDANFLAMDALIGADGAPAEWPKADVIIGNPPFLGAKRLKPERGADYVNAVRRAYPQVPGMADYCVYWFRKAHENLAPCTTDEPLTGRAGLVGTQNIRNNQSRVGGLDFIVKDGTILEAVDNQPWSGEANVHVSIADWVKSQDPKILPKTRRLWTKAEPTLGMKKPKWHGTGHASKEFELTYREVAFINSALSDKAEVGSAVGLLCNEQPKKVFQGITPGHDGFVLSPEHHRDLISDGKSHAVVHPYLTGREIVTGDGTPERFIIGFGRRTILEAQHYRNAFERIRLRVLPDLQQKANNEHQSETARKDHMQRWWMLWRDRREMFEGFANLSGRFIACSRVTKRPVFVFFTTTVWPSDKVQAFLFSDDYSFGIMQSSAHWQWFLEKCSKLKADFSYSIDSVFDTFPWPQAPNVAQIDAVAEAGRGIRRIRTEALKNNKGGLRALYRTLELPGKNPLKEAHAALDTAVLAAYGFDAEADLLAQLLALNLEVAHRIETGEPVTPPGLPATYPDPSRLITEDCIQPPGA